MLSQAEIDAIKSVFKDSPPERVQAVLDKFNKAIPGSDNLEATDEVAQFIHDGMAVVNAMWGLRLEALEKERATAKAEAIEWKAAYDRVTLDNSKLQKRIDDIVTLANQPLI